MTNTQKTFIKGAVILAVAGLIAKVIGALFRIPLANVLDPVGMGYYQMAYPIYSMLVVVSTMGLPTAVSKLVSESTANKDYAGAHYTFQVARRVLIALGIVTFVIMFALAQPIAALQAQPQAVYSLMAVSPALFFVSIMSAYRGYFQGLQYMVPTAISQLVEQLGKLGLGLTFAYLLVAATKRPELGAMGALVGVSVSEAIALAYMTIVYRKRKKAILARIEDFNPNGASERFKGIFKKIVVIAVPITVGACVMPIAAAVDSVLVSRILQGIGYTQEAAGSLYGLLTGYVNPLINMPAVLSSALAMSLVPALAEAVAQRKTEKIRGTSSLGFKLAILVGLPAALAFILLAQPIITLLYHNLSVSELEVTTLLLQLLSFGVLFLTIVQTMTGILQGMGKPLLPVFGLIAGVAVKIVVSILLLRMPQVNIYGAAIGTIACYVVATVMDIVFVLKHSKMKLSLKEHLLKPVAATAIMGVCVFFVYHAVGKYSNTAGMLAAIVVGILVYLVALMVLRGFSREELAMVPGGGKLERLMMKMRIWK